MSLSISTRYGSRANDPTLDYPTGSFKNKTAPDAVDGTPLEKDWANDLLGARDAILAEAGILASGVADTAQASQLLAALQTLGLRAATETQAGVLEIATAAEAQALVNDTNALTPAKLASVTATETRAGLIEIATTAEAQAFAAGKVIDGAKLAAVIKEGVTVYGSTVFTRTTNNIQKTGIVTELSLEIGDVIQVSGTTSNNKLFTVESITDDNNIVVNYEHRNGAGSLSLTNETVSCTIKLLCKWFHAPIGLGQNVLNLNGSRSYGVNYTNTLNRPIFVHIDSVISVANNGTAITVNGITYTSGAAGAAGYNESVSAIVPIGGTYSVSTVNATLSQWRELR